MSLWELVVGGHSIVELEFDVSALAGFHHLVLLVLLPLADAEALVQASVDDHLPEAGLKGRYGCHCTALALERPYMLQSRRLKLLI